ncbi:MAG: TIGR01459 family HAD-type hydrolase [Roseobacter sp.]
MIELSPSEAFIAYEAARSRMPKGIVGKPSPRRVNTLADLTDAFDVFLLDAFGVLNIGDQPIPGTPERVRDLQAMGKRVIVVSNAASVPVEDLLNKYKRLGYSFLRDDVITSRKAAIAAVSAAPDIHWGVMGLSGVSMSDFGDVKWSLLEDDPDTYSQVKGFLLLGSGEWTQDRHEILRKTLNERPRPVYVANPDIVAPRVGALSSEPGFFGHDLAETAGIAPVFFGKPFENIYDIVFQQLPEADRSRVVMVGDSLHTDVLGAQAANIASVLVSGFGFFAGQDVDMAISQSGIVPDFIVDRP